MSERWLREITDITGVEGALLVSSGGQIIENIGTPINRSDLEHISRHVLRIIASHDLVHKEIREIELGWSDYRILAMNTGKFIIIIFCSSAKVLSLLRITLNVVSAHIMEDRKTMKKINKFAAGGDIVLDKNDLDDSEINLISKLQ